MRLYLYALIDNKHTPDLSEIKVVANPEGRLSKISLGEIAAIVSDIDVDELMSTRRHMLCHTKVLETVMQHCSILPFSFGTIVDDMAALSDLIEGHHQRLVADLNALEGYIEVGIRATWNESLIFNEIIEENTDLERLAAQIKTRPVAETYHARIDLGREVEARMKAKKEVEANELSERLSRITGQVVTRVPGSDMVVLDNAYLIKAVNEHKLISELEAIDAENKNRFTFKVLSPVPPYNFVSLKLETNSKMAA